MLKRIENLRKDELVRGSLILILMIGVFNIFNYIFQMSMARMLGPSDYGILAVMMSFVYIFSIPSEAIQTIITRYVSRLSVKNEDGKIKDLLNRSMKKGIIFSTLGFLVYAVMAIFISSFLKIEFWILILTGLLIFYSFEIPILRGIMQGKKRFGSLGINLVIESFMKVVFSLLFVLASFKVYGAMGGVIFGGILAFLLGLVAIRSLMKTKTKRTDFSGIYRYNLPLIISITSIVLMYSLDVIIAKRFFSPEIAGQYAFVALIGKAIIFSSFAVGKAMFPISSEKFSSGNKTWGIFKNSMIITLVISGAALFFYFFFPEFVIRILSLGSSQYLAASNVLFILGLAFSFASFSNIIILYGLSINRIRRSSLFFLSFAAIEVVILSIFNHSIFEFSLSLMIVNLIMLLFSIYLIRR